MWETILVLAMVQLSSEELTGSNVCHVEKGFIVNATEYFIRNSTVRNYQWCMNVPPRCSYYTLKQVNASRIVEKEVKRAVPECCAGYEEKDNSCVQICPRCLHGECKGGKCDCHPGFQGDTCDRGCEPMKWGTNCKLNCTCERGTCLPITGNCICPSGWNGTECQHQCPQGSYGINCAAKCRCDQNELCHRITGECEKLPTTELLSTTTSFQTTTTTPRTTVSITNPSTTTTVQTNTVFFKNNGKFKPNKQIFLDNITTSSEDISDEIPFLVIDEQEKSIIPPSTSDDSDDDNNDDDQKKNGSDERGFYTKHPQDFKSSNEIVRATTGSLLEKENYLKDEAIREEENVEHTPSDKRDMVNGASAATAISVTLFVIVLAVIAAKSFKRKKEKAKKNETAARTSNGVSKVSVYTHSIFHTPLPDPPPFENPVFTPATENGDGTRFETRVVCSLNFPVPQEKDPREYLYDHPPSTGSYRAVSIPEPPDIDNVSLAVQTFSLSEPVYDEIPTGMAPTPVSEPPPSYKSSSLYMNTCGKTRL